MIFLLHTPGSPLNEFVENIIYYSGYCPLHTKEKLLPDGYIDLVIDLTDEPKHLYDNLDYEKRVAYRKGWVSGVRRDFITIDAGYDSSMIVVHFRPGRSLPFFGFPINELVNQVVELDCVWGNPFLSLRERIIEAESPPLRLAILEQFLLQIAHNRLEVNPAVDYAISLIRDVAPGIPISAVKERLGFSHKHFISLFGKYVGVRPNTFPVWCSFKKCCSCSKRPTSLVGHVWRRTVAIMIRPTLSTSSSGFQALPRRPTSGRRVST